MALSAHDAAAGFAPEQGAIFDLTTRAKLRLTGADRFRYLNGQMSNDLRKATEESAVHACVVNAKGKVNANLFITADGDAFLIDTDPGMAEALTARLDRYIIADDVQIEDVTEAFSLWHILAPGQPELSLGEAKLRSATRFDLPGTDVWLARSEHGRSGQELATLYPFCDGGRAETFRIERGLPRWGYELTDEIIPTEANLEASAIDYAKGCYIGQEVISRIKMSGQTNKRLCGFVVADDGAMQPGMRLRNVDDAKDVGWLTSVTQSERLGRQIALGFAKRGFQTPGTRLHAQLPDASALIEVEVVALPFV